MIGTTRRVVFFDAAGTLVHVRGSVGLHYAALARRFGVEAGPGQLDRVFPAVFRDAPPMAFPGAEAVTIPALERRWWQERVRLVFERVGLFTAFGETRFEEYFGELYRHFETAAAWEVYPDVVPLLRVLRRRGYAIGVISNFDGRLVTLLERLTLADWFDSVTLSSRVGAAKPDRAIFERALDHHAAQPQEALHVGDSLADDVRGATAAGLSAVLLDREGRNAGRSHGRRVTSLADVVRFL